MIALSVLIFCVTSVVCLEMYLQFKRTAREWKDNTQLAATLEERLNDLDATKQKMEYLLIKQGLGR